MEFLTIQFALLTGLVLDGLGLLTVIAMKIADVRKSRSKNLYGGPVSADLDLPELQITQGEVTEVRDNISDALAPGAPAAADPDTPVLEEVEESISDSLVADAADEDENLVAITERLLERSRETHSEMADSPGPDPELARKKRLAIQRLREQAEAEAERDAEAGAAERRSESAEIEEVRRARPVLSINGLTGTVSIPDTIPPGGPSDVNFRAFAPGEAAADEDMFVDLIVEDADNPVTDLKEEFGIDPGMLVAKQTAEASVHDVIEVELIQPDCEIEESVVEVVWTGRAENVRFLVHTPQLDAPKKLTFRLAIRINGIPMRRLLFQVDCRPGMEATATPELSEMTPEKYKRAFISYSSKDAAFAGTVAGTLEAAGIEPFVDAHGLRSGDDWKEKLLEAIRGSDLFLLCWSANAAASDVVGIEIETAWEQQEAPPQHRPDISPIAVSLPFPNLPAAIGHLHVSRRFAPAN